MSLRCDASSQNSSMLIASSTRRDLMCSCSVEGGACEAFAVCQSSQWKRVMSHRVLVWIRSCVSQFEHSGAGLSHTAEAGG